MCPSDSAVPPVCQESPDAPAVRPGLVRGGPFGSGVLETVRSRFVESAPQSGQGDGPAARLQLWRKRGGLFRKLGLCRHGRHGRSKLTIVSCFCPECLTARFFAVELPVRFWSMSTWWLSVDNGSGTESGVNRHEARPEAGD